MFKMCPTPPSPGHNVRLQGGTSNRNINNFFFRQTIIKYLTLLNITIKRFPKPLIILTSRSIFQRLMVANMRKGNTDRKRPEPTCLGKSYWSQ